MHITAIEPQRRDPDRVNIFVDGEFQFGIAAKVARDAGLRVGGSIERSELERVEQNDALWRAVQTAYGLLSYRARTRRELQIRLSRKQFDQEIIELCLARLTEEGWINDRAFAESFVRDRIRLKPRGTRRLVSELAAKGIDRAVAEPVVAATLESEGRSDLDLAREAARKWARGKRLDTPQESGQRFGNRRRLYGYLARRGFDSDVIRVAMTDVLRGRNGGE